MKLSKNDIARFGHLAAVNPQMIGLKDSDTVVSMTNSGSCIVKTKFEEQFTDEVCIYSIPDFLNFINLFEEPSLTIKNSLVKVNEADGSMSCNYLCADRMLMTCVVPEKFRSDDIKYSAKISLEPSQFSALIKHQNITKAEDISFVVKDGSVEIVSSTVSNNLMYETDNHMTMKITADIDNDFHAVIGVVDFQRLAKSGYDIRFGKFGELNMVNFTSHDGEYDYWISMKDNSKMGEQ